MQEDVITEHARGGLINEFLCADNLVLMIEHIGNLRERFLKWKETFGSKGMMVNLKKTKVMVSGLKSEVLEQS